MRLSSSTLVLGLISFASQPVFADCNGLVVEEAWIPAVASTIPMLVGYARLRNTGADPLRIDAIESADFGGTELYENSLGQNCAAEMHTLKGLDIPGHSSVLLAEHGKPLMLIDPLKGPNVPAPTCMTLTEGIAHLALMDPHHSFKTGDSVVLNFRCGKDSAATVFTVREAAP